MKQSMVGSEKQNQIGTAFAMGKNTQSWNDWKNNCFTDVTAAQKRTVEGRVISNSINSEIWQVGCKKLTTFLKSGQMP